MELDAVQVATFSSATAATASSYPPERRLAGDDLAGYLDRRVFAVLSTTRPDGRPHAALVSYVRRGTAFWMPTVEGSVRATNVARRPEGVLVIAEGDRDEHVAVLVEGPVAAVPRSSVPEDVAAFADDDWVTLWLRLDATRLLSHAAAGARTS